MSHATLLRGRRNLIRRVLTLLCVLVSAQAAKCCLVSVPREPPEMERGTWGRRLVRETPDGKDIISGSNKILEAEPRGKHEGKKKKTLTRQQDICIHIYCPVHSSAAQHIWNRQSRKHQSKFLVCHYNPHRRIGATPRGWWRPYYESVQNLESCPHSYSAWQLQQSRLPHSRTLYTRLIITKQDIAGDESREDRYAVPQHQYLRSGAEQCVIHNFPTYIKLTLNLHKDSFPL
jgi:hypothetical protein